MTTRELDQSTLDEIIRRVVEVAQPERIILFGSAVQGLMARNSDVDLLIVKEGGDAKNLRARIYENLYGVRVAVDAILVSPADLERYKDSHALVIKPALQDGKSYMRLTERFPPDDPREWLNRAKSSLAMAKNRVPDVYRPAGQKLRVVP